MRIDYYYWGRQCPHNLPSRDSVEQLRAEGHEVAWFDVTGNEELASSVNMFSPTLTIVDGKGRWHGPLFSPFAAAVARGEMPRQEPYRVKMSSRVVRASLAPLTGQWVADTREVCGVSHQGCAGKGPWVQEIMKQYQLPHLGFLHYREGKCIGGAEFVPSVEVPYRIPREKNTAFLTCSFVSLEEADYRSFPLERLEEALPGLGYRTLLAIASEEVVFPNGPLEWFLKRGYRDRGVVHEEDEYARMHLVEKELQEA